jgi:hypothetical protein
VRKSSAVEQVYPAAHQQTRYWPPCAVNSIGSQAKLAPDRETETTAPTFTKLGRTDARTGSSFWIVDRPCGIEQVSSRSTRSAALRWWPVIPST